MLIFGGVGSALGALAYGPASTALKNRALRPLRRALPAHQAGEAAAILTRGEDRNKLDQLVGVDRSIVADLQVGLAILGWLHRTTTGRPVTRAVVYVPLQPTAHGRSAR